MPTCLSEIAFGSYLVYSPRGQSPLSQQSRNVCYSLKNDRLLMIRRTVEKLKEYIATYPTVGQLMGILGTDVTLVPCPRRAPIVAGGLWPSERICTALVQFGLGQASQPWLERHIPIRRSASAGPGERPSIEEHMNSMRIRNRTLFQPRKIVVVDDVVTKGATMIAAASLLKESFPDADVKGFALVRTMGRIPDVTAIVDPCLGTIRNLRGEPDREP